MARRAVLLAAALLITSLLDVAAHEHHDPEVGPYEQNFVNDEPLDSTIKWHIAIQIFCWGLLFPAGMILGITRSRFHVPLQSLGIVLSLAGNHLGHHHSGREFHTTAHSHLAGYLWWYLMTQTAMGIFLKLHVLEGSLTRRVVVKAHGLVGKTFPIVGWTQMIFGGIAALGFCFGEHVGQCAAHFIMGSAFIAYAVLLVLMMRVGAGFLARRRMAQEYLDSWVIMLWGIVNTFTEHNFLSPHPTGWSHKDMQHVSLGVLWWAGGALGIWLGRDAKRNVVPAVIIGMTGYAMANHGQHLEFSTDVHKLFGGALMAAGFCRIVEICFVLRDAPTPDLTPSSTTGDGDGAGDEEQTATISPRTSSSSRPRAFQHLTPFLLVLSGLTFLSATEEQMQWVAGSGMDSTTYANILFSGAFAIYLVGTIMVDLYDFQVRRHKSTASAVGLTTNSPERSEEVERGRGDAAPLTVGGIRLPAAVAAVVAPVIAFAQRLEDGRGGEDRHTGRAQTAPYESLPLRSSSGRESVDVRSGHPARGGGDDEDDDSLELQTRGWSGSAAGREGGRDESGGSQETVFSLADEVEDDGSDAYWAREEKAR